MSGANQGPISATVEAQIVADLDRKAADDDDSFVGAVAEFIAASEWLGPQHKPALVTLRALARQLDQRVTAAMVSQFGVAFRDLRAQAPAAAGDDDGEVDSILDEARNS
ncbi:hypothetical protein [Agromyces archimandritae]|uniref:Uncharacterized protein n=1 Tax=Agromyces archimandritae TaxID=2781962 RepID=A0A975FL60_9MICO|nr:hypothetical protein [Agromyces archimandritae]QTX04119.1 hypothetical protein G127AT_12570 [Agromyces archimandritae]